MLVDEPMVLRTHSMGQMLSEGPARRLAEGVYEVGHFGSSDFLPRYEHYPDMDEEPDSDDIGKSTYVSYPSYGVCDRWEQVLEKCPLIEKSKHQFVITVKAVRADDQPRSGGWRWHKWGPYIGDQHPTTEYLHDESEIKQVFCFHIYQKKDTA